MQHSRRIDQPMNNCLSQRLYEPLRRSLLRNSLSQSNISSRGQLSASRLMNQQDLSTSRISKRMRSLSPQQVQTIKTNIFIPVNKRLLPTHNLQLIRNKRYQAIDVEEKVHKAIPAIRFNSLNRFNVNKVEQIVYQIQQQPHYIQQPHYVHQNQQKYQQQRNQYNNTKSNNLSSQIVNNNTFRKQEQIKQQNIYTIRNQTQYNNNRGYLRERQNSQSRRLNASNRVGSPLIQTPVKMNSSKRAVSPPPQMRMSATFGVPTSQTSFANNIGYNNPVQSGSILVNNNNNLKNRQNVQTNNNNNKFYASNQYNAPVHQSMKQQGVRQVPTSQYLPGSRTQNPPISSRTQYLPGSRTSFQLQRMSSQVSKGYDFSRLTSSTVNRNNFDQGVSEYGSRKRQEWKYNLYSIFDEPINTKCSKTGCFNNQLIASRPNIYQWQQ